MTSDVALSVDFTSTKKSGYQPFGMSHAFNNANELPMQLDNRTNDFGAAVEWVKPQGMFRAAFERSMFSNQFNDVMWDNPLQPHGLHQRPAAAGRPVRPQRLQQRQRRGPRAGSRRSRTTP